MTVVTATTIRPLRPSVRSGVVRLRLLGLGILLAAALAGLALSISADRPPGAASSGASAQGGLAALLRLPAAAWGPVSGALGRDDAGYRITGLAATNPAQRLSARFVAGGVIVDSGTSRLELAFSGIGRGRATGPAGPVAPVARGGSILYARPGLRETWSNGPLGLEQTFVVARRPKGAGALTLSVSVPAGSRLVGQSVRLPGGLSYTGLRATDATGRVLRSWVALRGGRALLNIDDAGAAYPITVDPYVQQAEITQPGNPTTANYFGYSVAVSGSTIVVGAPEDAYGVSAPGAAYVFTDGSGSWALEATLAPSDPVTQGGFGYSVAISGNTIAVGEPPGPGETYADDPPENVYIFEGNNGVWTSGHQTTELTASSAGLGSIGTAPYFGVAVAVSGSTLVVGAPNWQGATAGAPTGAAFVYTLNSSGGVASGPFRLTAATQTQSGNESFGYSVAVTGSTIVVGDPGGNEPGAAYVYSEPNSGWATTANPSYVLSPSDPGSEDEFGYAVAAQSGTVVVGADKHSGASAATETQEGALYVYEQQSGGGWPTTPNAELVPSDSSDDGIYMGSSGIAISGSTIVAGTAEGSGGDNRATAYVFSEPTNGWSGTVTPSATDVQPTFVSPADIAGNSATISSVGISGTTIVLGSDTGGYGSGQVFVFGPGSASTTTTPTTTTTTTPTTTAPTVGTAATGHASVSAESVSTKATCSGAATTSCRLSYSLTSKETLKHGKPTAVAARKKTKPATTTKTLTIGSGTLVLSGGASKTVKLTLNGTGKTLLAKFKTLPAYLTLSQTQASGANTVLSKQRVTFHEPKTKKRKK